MGRVSESLDRAQRRVPLLGFPIAVIYKYSDDQGNYLAAIMTYYAFIAIFPLLLLGSSILGFLLQGNPRLQNAVLDSALSQFPIIGDQLGRPEGLQGSASGVIIGSLVALYGALGLGTSIQNTLNIAWAVPRNKRPNPILLRLRSLGLLATAGVGLLTLSVASALSQASVFGETIASYRWPIVLLTVLTATLVLTLLMQMGVAGTHQLRRALPGAFVIALLWQTLQTIGTMYVTGVLGETSEMNQTFGLVLGLVGLLWIAAVMGVLGIEVNVVLGRRLWPRALLTVFSDRVQLTEADRRAYTSYARAQRHKRFQDIVVTYDESAPETQAMRTQPVEEPERRDRSEPPSRPPVL